ncbi:MAG: SRPBCC family protein [SAR202 cluster bacterium]|nr:SRPBCC family protein [SAR202 cluster bacterium]
MTQNNALKVIPLGERQWWSLEVLTASMVGLPLGIVLGSLDLALPLVLVIMAGGLAFMYAGGLPFRKASRSATITLDATPQQAFDAAASLAGRAPALQCFWGAALKLEPPVPLQPGATIQSEYKLNARPGTLVWTVVSLNKPGGFSVDMENRYRLRRCQGHASVTIEPAGNGSRVRYTSRVILPLTASHLMGAFYARLLLRGAARDHIKLLRQAIETPVVAP